MNSLKKFTVFLTSAAMLLSLFSCAPSGAAPDEKDPSVDGGENNTVERPEDNNEVSDIEVDDKKYDYVLDSAENGNYVYIDGEGNVAEFSVNYDGGTDLSYTVEGNTLTFSGIEEDSVYSLTGEFYGNIVIDVGEDYEFELEMNGFSITSSYMPAETESIPTVRLPTAESRSPAVLPLSSPRARPIRL